MYMIICGHLRKFRKFLVLSVIIKFKKYGVIRKISKAYLSIRWVVLYRYEKIGEIWEILKVPDNEPK